MLKSALGYFAGGTSQLGTVGGTTHELIGSTLELGNMNLRVKRVIAEGGFAVVFEATDLTTNKSCAVKRLLAHDAEKRKEIEQEIKFLKALTGHPNIIRFITAASSNNPQSGSTEYLVVMEYCPKGRLTDLLNYKSKLTLEEVICYFYQIARAVQHMHYQNPPIVHRDLKLENVLISNRGMLKLCDFGSATTETHQPDYSWSALKRSQVEDEIASHTTPMYRTPEMLDLYQNFPIDQQQDIWALGCTLYLLCFGYHPFEDSAKLRILNANYSLENKDTQYEVLHDLIKGCLSVDPRKRPSINDVVQRVEEIAEALYINLSSLLKKSVSSSPLHEGSNHVTSPTNSMASPPTNSQREAIPSQTRNRVEPPSYNNSGTRSNQDTPSGAMFNSFKSGASSFINNMKEASNKMVETVSNYTKGELDISYITSRILVMSYPADGIQGAVKNNIEDVKTFLDLKHPKKYAVYNLTQSLYRHYKFDNRVSDCGWPAKKSPSLSNLLIICKNMFQWLKLDKTNVAVIHCVDGKAQSALVFAAFFAFCNMYQNVGPSLHLFTLKRSSPGILPSHRRYVEYVADICNSSDKCEKFVPHNKIVRISNLVLKPVPLINSQRSGCKPFCEVYQNENRVFTTSQEYENIPGFDSRDDCVVIPLELDLCGDITFVVYHARSLLGGKVQAKNISLKMFQFQFNTGFLPKNSCAMKLGRFDLDYIESSDRFPDMFLCILNFEVLSTEETSTLRKGFTYDVLNSNELTPYLAVKDDAELHEIYRLVGAPEPRLHKTHEDDTFDFISSSENQNFPEAHHESSNAFTFQHTTENQTSYQNSESVAENFPSVAYANDRSRDASPIQLQADADVPSLLDFGDSSSSQNAESNLDPFGISTGMDSNFDPFKSEYENSHKESEINLFMDNPFESNVENTSTKQFVGNDIFGTDNLVSEFDSLGLDSSTKGSGKGPATDDTPNLIGDWNTVINTNHVNSSHPSSFNSQFSNQWPPVNSMTASQNNSVGSRSSNNLENMLDTTLKTETSKAPPVFVDPFAAFDPFAKNDKSSPEKVPSATTNPGQGNLFSSNLRSRSISPNPQTNNNRNASASNTPQSQFGNNQGTRLTPSTTKQPNYNLNIPSSKSNNPVNKNGAGIPPKMDKKADFSDLLDGFGVSSNVPNTGPKSLKDLKNQQQAEYMDPDEIKIRDWIEGKEGNIRALLCSLHKVTWEDSPWKECGMHQLVTAADVKKMWRKALLATHPDKQLGTPHEKLSKMIMIELNDAWDKYQNSGAQALYGN